MITTMNNTFLLSKIPTYRSKVVALPARVAPVVFERWWSESRHRSAGSLVETIQTHVGRLTLDATTWTRSSSGPTAPLRSVRGKLRSSGRRSWPVELELMAWSRTSSEVGLRFAGRRLPGPTAVVRYHELATAVLESIGSGLVELYPSELTADDLRRPHAA
jgi:hypothetical protein